MKALVFGGSGKMGAAVAWELARRDDVEQVGLVGRTKASLERTRAWLKNDKIRLEVLDIENAAELRGVMQRYDVGVSTLPNRRTSYKVAQTAIESAFPMVDMLEEFHRRPDRYETEGLMLPAGIGLSEYGDWLHEKAVENRVMFLSGIGFAPGLSNIVAGEGMRRMERARRVIARVGGIPEKAAAQRHPLRYMVTWSFEHVLREYMVKVDVIRGGKVVEVDATTGRERFRFNCLGRDEELECAITPGMPSFLFTRPDLHEFAEKTIRWPGHWQAIDTLKECGLLELQPVRIGESAAAPRDVLLAALQPRLQPQPGDRDTCVMWVSVEGTKDSRSTRIDYYLWDEADADAGISSMGRVTGFSAAIAAWMLGRGMLTETGIVAPEDCFYEERYRTFMEELAKHRIAVLCEIAPMEPSAGSLRRHSVTL